MSASSVRRLAETIAGMNAVARLVGFTVALALIFAGAALAGGALGPDRGGASAVADDGGHASPKAAHGQAATEPEPEPEPEAEPEADAVRGLAVSAGGLTLVLRQSELSRGRDTQLRFVVLESGGRRVHDFEIEHEKRMHLIVVRRDGQGFQHLHPELDADGVWHVGLTLPEAGAYRVFADFKRGNRARTLAADLVVDGDAGYQPSPAPAATADTGDGYTVRVDAGRLRAGREARLRFTVLRDGRAVATEPYLGAGGHLVALREGDLAYLHVHPDAPGDEGHAKPAVRDEAISLMTEMPSAGRYRLYLQFKHERAVHTAEFTQEVAR